MGITKSVKTNFKSSRTGSTIMDVRKIAMTGMLSAVSTVLMFLSFNVPLMPTFIKMDFSELPALIAAFSLGPVSGVIVCLVKNLVNLINTTTGGVGEFCNFLLGASFVLPAGLIYQRKKTKLGALIGAFLGCVCMALLSFPINYFIVYPIYTKIIPLEGIVGMYQLILPKVKNLAQALLIFNMPFTFVKGLSSVLITSVIYKPLSPIIKGSHSYR